MLTLPAPDPHSDENERDIRGKTFKRLDMILIDIKMITRSVQMDAMKMTMAIRFMSKITEIDSDCG